MRARTLAVAFALAASLMGLSQWVAGAEAPTPVVINAHPCTFGPPVETGPWEASGGINDSGTWVKTGGAASPPNATFLGAETVREEFLFTSLQGTFMVHAEERAFGPGVWQIEPGTGAYAATSGHGETAFFTTPTPNSCTFGFRNFTFALTGVASKVG
jgi:hypothetical protein